MSQAAIITIGDKGFITPEGYQYLYATGACRSIQQVILILGRQEVEGINMQKRTLKLKGFPKHEFQVHHFFKQMLPAEVGYNEVVVIPDMTVKGTNVMDLLGKKAIHSPQPLIVGRMPMGTEKHASTVFVLIEDPRSGESICHQTTMKLFLDAADKLRKFDDPSGN